MKKEIRELIETKIRILNEKKSKDGDVMNISVPWIKSDVKNQNGRIYPKALLQREIARVQSSVKKGSFIGTGDHPASGLEDIETASHIVTALSMDENGQGTAELRILPTTRGKNIQTLIRNNATLGVSCRGFGNIGRDGTVLDDYKLMGLDIVTNPSFKNATFSQKNVFESLSFEEKNLDTEAQKELEEAVDNLESASFLNAVESGFKGTQAEWVELYGGGLRKMMGLQVEDGKTTVQKLTEETINARILSFYNEAVQGGFRDDLVAFKKEFPRLVEQASEEIKIPEKKEPKEKFKAKITWSEAVASGFTGTIEEYKKEYPDVELLLPAPAKKVVVETLTEEAERIYSALKKENPNSSVTLESVKQMLEKEEIVKSDKRLRKRAIAIVSRDLDGSMSQEQLEKMVAMEIEALKEDRRKMREKNWQCYKKLLSD